MTGSFSDYLENKILGHVLGKTAFTMPTVYVALCTSVPTDASTGSNIVEPTGGSYARKVTAGSDWSTPANGSINNSAVITFVTATADWGECTHFALVDAATGGNVLAWGNLAVTKNVLNGDTASFAVNSLVINLD